VGFELQNSKCHLILMPKFHFGVVAILSLVSLALVAFRLSHVNGRKTMLDNIDKKRGIYAKPFPPMSSWYDIEKFLESENLKTGAELGVQTGNFALHILTNWPSCTRS
jgi:hypothetical protein